MKIYLFEGNELPDDFQYPNDFLKFVSSYDEKMIKPWRILGESKSELIFFRTSMNEIYTDKPLIPFARLEDSANGDLACFDGSDISGNPRIFFHVYCYQGELPSWDKRYSLDNFNCWLEEAQEEASFYDDV
ncbi:hypothetical protein [Vibrio gazogenes]|uniref:SMI1/KNR4 family protein n=1 Tax=Vibrio gazogenes TaxID=687 RepID=A0A1Z2SL01_VIBGA|nr:hypothetical protein [Vibrio gazogenes]ASA57883.1 hypothetical protein BSQ33_19385 [Vibrio gazogenes]